MNPPCPNHGKTRVQATVQTGDRYLCAPCAAKERVLGKGVPALASPLLARAFLQEARVP